MTDLNRFAPPNSSNEPERPKTRERKVGVWRASLAGVLTYILAAGLGFVLIAMAKLFFWTAIYGAPYVFTKEPVNPDSGEWLFLQGLGCLCALAAGAAIKRWSAPKSHAALIVVTGLFVFLSVVQGAPSTISIARNTIFFLQVPLGFLLGACIYHWGELKTGRPTVQPQTREGLNGKSGG